MSKDMFFLNAIILFYILQRISEMHISNQNEKWLKENCSAVEVDPKESLRMKIFHTFWFIALIIEANIKKDFFPGLPSVLIYSVLGLCLAVRFYSMDKLKCFWTIKIYSLKKQVLVTDGLYKYIRHPNYLIVVIEFIFLPLLFKAYFTLFVFSILNIFVLKNRIKLEEETLMAQSNYRNQFMNVKRLVPFFSLFIFLVSFSSGAKELNIHYKDFNEAKQSGKYIKFEGASTKLGFITTGFEGFIKDYNVNYELVNDQLSELTVDIATKSLDTNNDARNEKMLSSILETMKFPVIKAAIAEKVVLSEGEKIINMIFTVKDKKVSRAVKFKVEKKADGFFISGSTSLGIKEMGLPDPSIVIAKVDDSLKLYFTILL